VPWLIAAAIGLGLIGYQSWAGNAPPPTSLSLTGKVWQWTSYSGDLGTGAIEDPELYTIVFNEDGTAVVTADCNRSPWSYTIEGSLLRPGISLRSHAEEWSPCAPGSRAQLFVDHLWPTDSFRVSADRLELLRETYGISWDLTLKASP
jgi:hypothetical protein